MPRGLVVATLIVLAGVVVVAVIVTRPPTPVALSPPPSPIASPTPSPSATPGSTPSASPSPQGLYVSKLFGYALDLPPPWRKMSCPGRDPTRTTLPHFESFTNVSALDEEVGDIGLANDQIQVVVQANPQGLSPVEFAKTGIVFGFPYSAGGRSAPQSVTFAGRPAAELAFATNDAKAYFVGDGDRMFAVVAMTSTAARAPDLEAILRVVATFRLARAADVAALPDPTPFPAGAPTAQALAALLATAFQQKDIATLERLLGPCVEGGVAQGGGSAIARERFIASLRIQFANGLSVDVDTSVPLTDPNPYTGQTSVRSRWNASPPMSAQPPPSPGQTLSEVDLVLAPTTGGFYWYGTVAGVR